MLNKYCIYGISNSINCKIYIGQTNNFNRRKTEHFNNSGKNRLIIDKSIHKHGKHNFQMFLIEICESKNEMNEAEIFYIKYFKSLGAELYNIESGGSRYKEISQETKDKISKANIGRSVSIETRIKIGNSNRGKIMSNESRQKMSKSKIGVKIPIEVAEKISKTHLSRKYKLSEKNKDIVSKRQSKPIISIDK